MRRHPVRKVLKVTTLVVLLIAGSSLVVMLLWNGLMPALFAWQPISFLQAMGILVLSKILFGGFRGGRGAAWHWRGRMLERWQQMTPEERQVFRRGMRGVLDR